MLRKFLIVAGIGLALGGLIFAPAASIARGRGGGWGGGGVHFGGGGMLGWPRVASSGLPALLG